MKSRIDIKNKKANFEYHIDDTFTAGIKLTGTEIKSIRDAKASVNEAYCYLHNGDLWVKNMHVAIYEPGSYNNHEPKRERKLLLNKSELQKIERYLKVKGTTIIPLHLFISESGYAKLKIGVAKGKKIFDKREDIKKKDAAREIDRVKKMKGRK